MCFFPSMNSTGTYSDCCTIFQGSVLTPKSTSKTATNRAARGSVFTLTRLRIPARRVYAEEGTYSILLSRGSVDTASDSTEEHLARSISACFACLCVDEMRQHTQEKSASAVASMTLTHRDFK